MWCVREELQRVGLLGVGVPKRGGRGVLEEVNTVEFHCSHFTWRRQRRERTVSMQNGPSGALNVTIFSTF